jgi:hypothetical protein
MRFWPSAKRIESGGARFSAGVFPVEKDLRLGPIGDMEGRLRALFVGGERRGSYKAELKIGSARFSDGIEFRQEGD